MRNVVRSITYLYCTVFLRIVYDVLRECMAVLREKILRFTCNTCMYGIHFVWREWGDEWAMGRGGGLSGLGEKLRGGGSIAGITFGHVAGGGICVLGAGGTL